VESEVSIRDTAEAKVEEGLVYGAQPPQPTQNL